MLRHRLLGATFLVATLGASGVASATVVFDGVAAGDMTSNDTILWTRADNGGSPTNLTAEVSTAPSFGSFTGLSGATSANADYTLKLDATGLAANTQYYYRFVDQGSGAASQVGTFKTAPLANAAPDVRFGFSGDADGRFRPYPSIANLSQQNLSFFVFLGDTMYETASTGSPAVPVISGQTTDPAKLAAALTAYNGKYLNNVLGVNPATGLPSSAGQQSLQPMLAATGEYTLLDNHELGNKSLQSGGAPPIAPQGTTDPQFDVNTTGAYNNKTAASQTVVKSFLDYHPTRESILGSPATGYTLSGPQVVAPSDPRSNATPKQYFSQQWGANAVYIQTDDRSYRDIRLNNAGGDDTGPRADNPQRTMLGMTQLGWLENTLLQAQASGTPWKFVAISSPIDQVGSGTGPGLETQDGKSWFGGYRAERNQLLKFIADNHIEHVVFLTTDDHQTRTTQLQYVPDPVNHPDVTALVPGAFQVLTGPIGAGGPDAITDHDFAYIQQLAEERNASQLALGQPQLGLPADFAGLMNVYRAGDPNAAASPSPFDFFSPDTFNYTTLDVAPDGVLTVQTWGIPSYQQNVFPQTPEDAQLILSYQIGIPEPATLAVLATCFAGLAGLRRRR